MADKARLLTRTAWLGFLLVSLSLAHIFVFGWRVMEVGKKSNDSFNYIEVARNLSAGEGLVQSAPGFNQPGFWGEKFASDFPPKTQSAHNVGYPLAIFAVAELVGIGHADAAHLIGALSYAAVFALSFALALRLWGIGAAFLAVSLVVWVNGRSVFQHAWTESPAVALLFGSLFLLTARAGGASFAVAGVLSGVAFMQRAAMLPLVGVGVLAAAMRKEKKALSLALFLLGASVGIVRFFLERKSEYETYSLRSFRQIFHHFGLEALAYLWKMGPFLAVVGALMWILRRRQKTRTGMPDERGENRIFFLRAGEIVLLAWILGYSAFLFAVFSVFVSESFASSRIIYPLKIVTLIFGIGMLWRVLPIGRARTVFAASVFALSVAVGIVRDVTALATKPEADKARIASSELLRWAEMNISPNDFIIGHDVVDFPYYFDHVDSVVSFSPWFFRFYGADFINEEKIAAIVDYRCGQYANFYLIVERGARDKTFGSYLNRFVAGETVERATQIADLQDGLVYRLNFCDDA